MKVKAHTKTLGALLITVAALVAAPVAQATAPLGPADGWVAGKLDYGQPDGWTARALEGGASASYPDGWMARALEGGATASYLDGWTARALEGGSDDRAFARALTGGTLLVVTPDDRSFSRAAATLGSPDGWMPRALTPLDIVSPSPDSRNVSFRSPVEPLVVPSATTSASPGFDWTDAGIGAAGSFAVLLLVGVAVAVARRSHPRGRLAGS